MTEGLFILTTIFVAYVVYVIVNEPKSPGESVKADDAPRPEPVADQNVVKLEVVAAVKTAVADTVKPVSAPAKQPAKVAAKPNSKANSKVPKASAKPVPVKPAPAEPTPVVSAPSKSAGLKDPATGEISSSYSNYRFTKRWIKDALVTEGLLPKVYKNAELDTAIEAEIKAAVIKLEALAKYKP